MRRREPHAYLLVQARDGGDEVRERARALALWLVHRFESFRVRRERVVVRRRRRLHRRVRV